MSQLRFNRQIFAKIETTEGQTNSPTLTAGSTDYIETIEPTFSIQPIQFERNVTRGYYSTIPRAEPSTGTANAEFGPMLVEFRFGVEIGSGTSISTTAPRWGRLLQACSFAEVQTSRLTCTAIPNGQPMLQHLETLGANNTILGDYGNGESEIWSVYNAAPSTGSQSGSLSGCAVTSLAVGTNPDGYAYRIDTSLGQGNSSSLTMTMMTDGVAIIARGCRGTVEFTFENGNIGRMNFTFTGILVQTGNANNAPAQYTQTSLPPKFRGASMVINNSTASAASDSTSLMFNAMTIAINNKVVVRQNSNDADGLAAAAIITGRAPTGTWNPDLTAAANAASSRDFYDHFCAGDTLRTRFALGQTDGNIFYFRMPALLFTGQADGSRDEIAIVDASFDVTGGTYRKAVSGGSSTALGNDNEFVLICS